MFFAFEWTFNCSQLIVISNSFLFKSLHNLFVGLAYWLCFIVFDHDLIEIVFQYSNLSHEWWLFRHSKFSVTHLIQFILQLYESLLFSFGEVFGIIQFTSPIILILNVSRPWDECSLCFGERGTCTLSYLVNNTLLLAMSSSCSFFRSRFSFFN